MKKIIAICICLLICMSFAACGEKSDIKVPMGMQLASNEYVPDYIVFVP